MKVATDGESSCKIVLGSSTMKFKRINDESIQGGRVGMRRATAGTSLTSGNVTGTDNLNWGRTIKG